MLRFLENCFCFRPTTATENNSMPDWTKLPKELLQLIFKKLDNSELYLIRFRSVCSTWHSSIPNYHHKHLPPLKLLEFSNPNKNNACPGYLVTFSAILIKPPTHKQQTLRPFLITMRPNFLYRNIQLLQNKLKPPSLNYHLPFHFPPLVDFNQLSVLDIGHIFYIIDANQIKHNPYDKFYPKKVVTATCEGEQPFLIVTFDFCARPMMFRCGDNRWTRIPYLSQSLGKSGDICLFKGRPYVVDKTGLTAMIRPDLSIHLVADPMFCGGDKFLVECDCELLLVDINVSDDGSNDLRIHVYRLDEKERKWIKLANLGDMVLLLGNQISFSASASDLGFPNGNCIILNAGDLSDCFEMDIFQLDQGRVSPLCDNPDYLKLFLPSPEWMVELQP